MDVLRKLVSKDGSVKYLFKLADNNTIETLYMHDNSMKLTYHSTVCVSSQVGCKLGCTFCATGKQGYTRNLTVEEILDQVNICSRHCKDSCTAALDAVVFAGMGEPLFNYENIRTAIYRINSDMGINSFEIATVGIVPRIYEMIKDFSGKNINIRLNLSLHAVTNELRRKLMPVNDVYDVNSIINAAVEYARAFNSKVRVRYMLLKDLNNTEEDIMKLFELLENKPVKLVVSQYNENSIPGLIAPAQSEVLEFYNKIRQKIDCEVFHSFGNDIQGGCGQLKQAEIEIM